MGTRERATIKQVGAFVVGTVMLGLFLNISANSIDPRYSPALLRYGWSAIVVIILGYIVYATPRLHTYVTGMYRSGLKRRAVLSGCVLIVIYCSWVATNWVWNVIGIKQANPKIKINNVSLQGLYPGGPLKAMIYLKNDSGVDCTIEHLSTFQSVDHLAALNHRNETEAYLFTSTIDKVKTSPAQAVDIRANEDITLTVGPSQTPPDLFTRFYENGALYFTAVLWYAGRPDLKQIEICEYWTPNSPHMALPCHSHNDVGR